MNNTSFRTLIPVGVFSLLYTLVAATAVSRTSNSEFLLYIAVMVVLFAAIAWLHARVGLSTGLLWCLSFWGMLHMAGGLVPVPVAWPIEGDKRVLYSWWLIPGLLKYDMVIHAYGFGVTTWACWQSLRAGARRFGAELQPTFGLMLLCVAGGMGFGAMNEVVEFIATLTVPETNVGGYVNTGWDLISNLVGATTAAASIAVCSRRR